MPPGNAKQPRNELSEFENVSLARGNEVFRFRLYVTGTTPISSRAVVNVRKFCEMHLANQYELEVVDILQSPALAAEAEIVAAPTLEKRTPSPVRRFVGDMSRTGRMLEMLDIVPARKEPGHG